ncbi:23182_t:CDS:1, partial [Gigaspora margarita]
MAHKIHKYQAKLGEYYSQRQKLKKIVKSLEETIDWIENYIEEQTGLEFSKKLLDSDLDLNLPS